MAKKKAKTARKTVKKKKSSSRRASGRVKGQAAEAFLATNKATGKATSKTKNKTGSKKNKGKSRLREDDKAVQVPQRTYAFEIASREQLIAELDSAGKPLNHQQLAAVLNMHERDEKFEALGRRLGAMVRDGGLMICSTINRTFKAFSFAILGAEYILRWLPRGTHQYAKLVKPLEIRRWLLEAGLEPEPSIGMSLNPLSSEWRFSDDLSINYVTVGLKS